MSPLILRLYIAGSSPNSVQALANLRGICRSLLREEPQIEIVDVLDAPQRALGDGVWISPTLIRIHPLPVRRIIGNLSDQQAMVDALNLSIRNNS
ncbi:MAG: circadian clock KaiB family protein [Verrucomicrobia bacterium]|nr:circadian clock KaiB family protein [Verrucomicrobiota bacterium]MBV9658603.1 circadian clock KaiB family protein [Verrucomicrobiota bacterium]